MAQEEIIPKKEKGFCPKHKWYWAAAAVVLTAAIAYVVYQVIVSDRCLPESEWCFKIVDTDLANGAHKEFYYRSFDQEEEVYMAFSVNRCQLQAMELMFCKNGEAEAVRFYPGIEPGSEETVYLLIAVDKYGIDFPEPIVHTSGEFSGLCPRYCDQNSAMIVGEVHDEIVVDYGQEIDVKFARQMVLKYIKQDTVLLDAANAFSISKDLFSKMNVVLQENLKYQGIRLYLGIDRDDKRVILFVPFTVDGKDLTSPVFTANPDKSGLCPRYCDFSSPVLRGLDLQN